MCAPASHRPYEQDCGQCALPELRERWGCDAPSKEPCLEIQGCVLCDGRDENCSACEGTDYMPFDRCPNAVVGVRERMFVQACVMVEQGVLPAPGGWDEQAHVFVIGYPVVMEHVNNWRELERERARKAAEQKAKNKKQR